MAFVATAAVGGAVVGGLFGRSDNKRTNATNKDIAETPTRITGIDELLSELERSAEQTQSASLSEFVNQQQNANSIGSSSTQSDSATQSQEQSQVSSQQDQQQTTATSETGTIDSNTAGSQATDQQTSTTGTTTGTVQGSVQRGSDVANASLDGIITELSQSNPNVQAAVQSLMQRVLREGQGVVNDNQANTGTFDSTTSALLQNDLNTRAAEAGASLQLQEEAAQQERLLAAIGASQQGTETTTQATQEEQAIQEALAALTTQQQKTQQQTANQATEVGNTSTTGTQTEQVASQSNTQEQANQSTSTTEQVSTATNTESTEDTQASSTENVSQTDTSLSDQYQNPNDSTRPVAGSALGDLVNTGQVSIESLLAAAAGDGTEDDGQVAPSGLGNMDVSTLLQTLAATRRKSPGIDMPLDPTKSPL